MKIAVLIASFNRAQVTLRGIDSLVAAAGADDLEIFLLDDASPDQTGPRVKARYPQIHLVMGNGGLFWNRGMCRAYEAARACGTPFDAYLLFNDDVVLDGDALARMTAVFAAQNSTAPAAIVGAMRSANTGETTYYGHMLDPLYNPLRHGKRRNPGMFRPVLPNGVLQECDTFSGNCVLIPAAAMDRAGGLDPKFHHSSGDVDLGMTLRKQGCKTYLMPEPVGDCEREPLAMIPRLGDRLRGMFHPPRSIFDDVRMAFKYFPPHIAVVNAGLRIQNSIHRALFPRNAEGRNAVRLPPLAEAAARDLVNVVRPRAWRIDTFLVSFPKSGRTWLELMLAQGFARRYGLPAGSLSRDLTAMQRRAGVGPVIFTTHDWSEVVGEKRPAISPHLLFAYGLRLRYWRRRVLMLIRDPRDTIVSNFYQATQRSFYPLAFTDIDEYVLHPLYGFPRLVRFFQIWAFNRHFVRAFHLVKYEALMRDDGAVLRGIFEFTGLGGMDDETAHAIYESCSMGEMRRLEAAGAAGLLRFAGPQASKVRRGVVGGYQDELRPETIAALGRMMAEIPEPFRYPV